MSVSLISATAFVLAALVWYLGRMPITRWVMAGSIIAGCITLPSEFYVNSYLASEGCVGNWMKGLNCPDWSVFITLANAHQMSGMIFFLYLMLVFPIIWALLVFSEIVLRVQNHDQRRHRNHPPPTGT